VTGQPGNQVNDKARAKAAIAAWRDVILQRTGWTAKTWARKSEVTPSTVTRTMDESSPSTVRVETLHALARGAGLPSVLDLLEEQAGKPVRSAPELQDAETLARLMAIAMRVAPEDRSRQADLLVYAHGVAAGLRRLSRSPANRDNPGYLEAVEQDVLDAVAVAQHQP
jgi:hypothetical protein